MKQELIKNHMSSPAITISIDATLPDAHKKMMDNNIRRLPVIDGTKLAGIISLSDILEAKPSDATSLSIWEINYLVTNMHVGDLMTKNVQGLSQDDSISEAARLMLEKKIGGLPVTDSTGGLVGMVTESDIFRLVAAAWA